jgi:hypothetical protein
LEQLDENRRAVFVMVELEHMTAPEISAALSANLNTAYRGCALHAPTSCGCSSLFTLRRQAVVDELPVARACAGRLTPALKRFSGSERDKRLRPSLFPRPYS